MGRQRSGARSAVTLYYRWTEKTSPDMASYKTGQFSWTYKGMRSRKAFWVFKLGSGYRPSRGIQDERILLVFDFGDRGTRVIEDTADNLIYSEDEDFSGEAQHPMKVIQKRNEQGAFGIGASLLEFLQPARIRLATKKEIADALGLKLIEVKKVPDWPTTPGPPPGQNLPGQLLHR